MRVTEQLLTDSFTLGIFLFDLHLLCVSVSGILYVTYITFTADMWS